VWISPSCCCARTSCGAIGRHAGHYRERFGAILVDEFQDTNSIQYAWLRLLAGERTSCSWSATTTSRSTAGAARGSRTSRTSRRPLPDAPVVRLEQNYRSTGNILNAANAVIANNPTRLGKQLWTEGDDGEPIRSMARSTRSTRRVSSSTASAQAIDHYGSRRSECAILYRTTRSRGCSKRRCCRPASRTGSTAACGSSSAPRSRTRWPICAWCRTATTTRRSSAPSTAAARHRRAPLVFMTGMEDGLFPHQRSIERTPTGLEEERRLCYVGASRGPMQSLYVTYAEQRRLHGMDNFSQPSRFIAEIPVRVG
jgi:superfamily I DNA/RNA helicase